MTPAGFAVFALRQNGTLISEASVPAAHAIRSGRIIATAGGAVTTGIAIMNPNSAAVVISFYFTDASGQNSHQEASRWMPVHRSLDSSPRTHSKGPHRWTELLLSYRPFR